MTPKELKITFVSHACLRIEGEFGTLVCDPWILNEPVFNFTTWKFPAARMKPEEIIAGMDYLLLTHTHEDHFHAPSLDHFPRDVQLLIPEYDWHPSIRAQGMERSLLAMGFHNIRKFKAWDRFFLGGKTPITFIPAAKTRDHDWENCGFVLEHHDCTIINMNDNLNDIDLCSQIMDRFKHFDLAFVQTAGVSMFPGCFRMSDEEMRIATKNKRHSFEDQKRTIERLRPKRIAPFAGDFCWLDDKYFHNNWACRATPKIFDEMVSNDYPNEDIEVITFHPSDTWTMGGGHVKNHPPVDWNNYVDEIRKVQTRLRGKIDAINNWIEDSPQHELEKRTRHYTAETEKWITKDYIFFRASVRIQVEGPNSNFSFVLKANYDEGFHIVWDTNEKVDQTLFIPQAIWSSVMEGKLMWNIVQWCSQAQQHVPYRIDIGRFFFWLEYHVDLNNRIPQVLLESRLHPRANPTVRPQLGVFRNEHDLA